MKSHDGDITTRDKMNYIYIFSLVLNFISGDSGNSDGGMRLDGFFMSIDVEIMPKYGLEVDFMIFVEDRTHFCL